MIDLMPQAPTMATNAAHSLSHSASFVKKKCNSYFCAKLFLNMSGSTVKETRPASKRSSFSSKFPPGTDGFLLLCLMSYIGLTFDPYGVPFQRLSEICGPLIVGALLWACFHSFVSFLISPTLSSKLKSLYSNTDGSSSRNLDDQHCEFLNRSVSFVHATLSFSFALFVLSRGFEIGHRNTQLQSQMLMFSATYFLFDYCYVTYHRLGDALDMVHHFISVGGLLSTLLLDQCGGEVVCAIVVTEVSNPFLHTRKLLQIMKLHKEYPVHFQYNNYMFALSYLIGRMFFGGWFVYRTIESPNSPFLMKVASCSMLFLSAIWFKRILDVARAPPDSKVAQQ